MARPTEHPTYCERALQLGCEKGLDVWELQIKLIGWGSGSDNDGIGNTMDPMRLTGEFDTTTRDAVMRFQKAHELPVNGIVDSAVFTAIDREIALHPVLVRDFQCPCARGDNDGPILCRCTGMDTTKTPPEANPHPDEGKCAGFGKKRYGGKFLLDDKKLADGTELKTEKLELYDMQEYEGVDKAVLWAVRAILHRSELQSKTKFKTIQVISGYRCWHDNYHHTNDVRWRHSRQTFHFGKAIEFLILDHCTVTEWDDNKDSCPQCDDIRKVALAKCGFQSRWQQPGRVSIAEGIKKAQPPATPFSVHLDTVRVHERKNDGSLAYTDHFVKTDADAAKPLQTENLISLSFPLVLAAGVNDNSPPLDIDIKLALDPKSALSEDFFRNTETGPGGWYPVGLSRTWHGGIHLYGKPGTPIHAIADGEIVGCRAGENEEQPSGSRNFVLLKHTIKSEGKWKGKEFYSLYMHLDGEEAKADAKVRWRKELFNRSKAHVEASIPAPIFELKDFSGKKRFVAKPGVAKGETLEITTDAEEKAHNKDDQYPNDNDWKILKLANPADHYFFTKRDGTDFGEKRDAVTGVDAGKVVGLKKPIKVYAGEVIGSIAKAATEDPIKKLASFVHLETFSESELPVDNFFKLDATDKNKVLDRKEVVAALVKAKLLPEPHDGVLKASELKAIVAAPPYHANLRSVVLKMPSAWSLEWKDALKAPKSLGFLKHPDEVGRAWDKYNWWKEVKDDKGKLPANPKEIFHYHPVALILQIACS